jgi:hemerythrin-like domain-containing protein
MNTSKPIKRYQSLQSLSHEHHDALLLCWKIRTAFTNNIPVERVKKYSDWFYQNHVLPHFSIEEKSLYPVLGNNELVKKAIQEHRRLSQLFESKEDVQKTLLIIANELETHIRFEERVLFGEIQKAVKEDELDKINLGHAAGEPIKEWADKFWELK